MGWIPSEYSTRYQMGSCIWILWWIGHWSKVAHRCVRDDPGSKNRATSIHSRAAATRSVPRQFSLHLDFEATLQPQQRLAQGRWRHHKYTNYSTRKQRIHLLRDESHARLHHDGVGAVALEHCEGDNTRHEYSTSRPGTLSKVYSNERTARNSKDSTVLRHRTLLLSLRFNVFTAHGSH